MGKMIRIARKNLDGTENKVEAALVDAWRAAAPETRNDIRAREFGLIYHSNAQFEIVDEAKYAMFLLRYS